MADESSSARLYDSLDPVRQLEFIGYCRFYQEKLLRHASNILKDSKLFREWDEIAPHCVQETFIRLLEAICHRTAPFIADNDDPEYVKNWLYEVNRNFAYVEIQRRKRHPQTSLEILDDIPGSGAASEDNLIDKAYVDELLAKLDPTDEAVIRLKYEHGLKSGAIGPQVEMHPDAVRARQARALKKLRKLHFRE